MNAITSRDEAVASRRLDRVAGAFSLLWIGLVGGLFACGEALAAGPGGEDDLAKELPRIKPLSPDKAMAAFKVHAGFHLETVAAEPIVASPVCACYDADGRLYVVEMRGYPYPEDSPTGNVRRLEDVDGDGKFDRGTIFVDGLSWPTGVVPYDGGVFIAVAPEILFAKDTDGDGVADVRKVMFRGFGTQNVQALVNGLLWGPDGWIYGVSGGNGGEIRNLSRPDQAPVSVRGQDFRFRPDGSAFEAISGGGQFGHAFDDWGRRFTCNNSNHIRQIVLEERDLARNPALSVSSVLADIAVEGPAAPVFRISPPEPWRVVRTRQRVADPVLRAKLPPTEQFATGFFTSATGVTVYRGSAFPPEYRGNAFIGDVGANLVHRKILRPAGAIEEALRADRDVEFLASADNWFRPVSFANTPDGTLLVLDMYRETIEHPASIPEPIKKHLDLTSGRDKGRLYEIVPDDFRRRSRPVLGKAPTAELVALLDDRDAWWRETAHRLLLERRDTAAIPLLRALRPRPGSVGIAQRLWALDALGALSADDLRPALSDPEPNVRAASVRLIGGRLAGDPGVVDRLIALAIDPVPEVRFRVAIALGNCRDERVASALARIAARDRRDPWTRAAVASSLAGRLPAFLEALGKEPEVGRDDAGLALLEEVAALAGAERRAATMESFLANLADPGTDLGRREAVALGMDRGLRRSGGTLRELLKGTVARQVAPLFAQARNEARSPDLDPDRRARAARVVGLGPGDDAIGALPELLDARHPVEVQLASLRALGDLSDRRVGPEVAAHWKALSPQVRREAAEILVSRPERLIALLDAIETGAIAANELDAARGMQLQSHRDASIRDRAKRLFGGITRSDRRQAIEALRPALSLAGERSRGRAVFQKSCATCHRAEGQGESVGPDLATITGRMPEDLLIHIVDPNREVPPSSLDYRVATTDGREYSGIIAAETANDVTLRRAAGVTDVIPRDRIESIASTGISLMPEGLEKGLSTQDFADLLAYLGSLSSAPVTPK
jgi:putative membrane-bound dehydrogenase-like protein